MKKRIPAVVLVILALLLVMTVPVMAAQGQMAKASPTANTENTHVPDVKTFTYPNGLILLVVERHDAPVVACYRFNKVGSANEYPGVTGAAHLLEHMMFKGTANMGTWNYAAEKPIMDEIEKLMDEIDRERSKGLTAYQKPDKVKIDNLWKQVKELQEKQRQYIRKNDYDFIMSSQGAQDMNASTWFEQTDYYTMIPANKLEVWAYLDSDRMKTPVFREFYSERDVVYEERRMYMNEASGAMFEAMLNTMFTTMPYGHEIVGFTSDLESMRREEVEEFLKRYYAPNNTIIALVGDVKAQDAQNLVARYFGEIPRQPDPKPLFHQEPKQKGERRTDVEFDAEPQMWISYHGPTPGNPDQYALEVLAQVLSGGRSSRFYQNLVKTEIAYEADFSQWNQKYTNIEFMYATPRKGVTMPQLEAALYKEIERLKTEPVAAWELEKVRNQVEKDFIEDLVDPMDLASNLARNLANTGDWRNFDERAKIKAVTPEDIMRVAKTYLVKSNRSVITLVPTKAKDSEN